MRKLLWIMFFALFGQVVEPAKDAKLKGLIPKTDDPAINAVAKSDSLMTYTRDEMPLIYFHEETFHDGKYDIGPDDAPRPHNGSREFPWNLPGGTHRCGTEVTNFKFMALPPGQRVAVYRSGLPEPRGLMGNQLTSYVASPGYSWKFPEGTVFGEVLLLYGRPFELRTRKKVAGDQWDVDLFRPFRTADALSSALPPDNAVAKHLRQPFAGAPMRLVDRNHPTRRAIDVKANVDVLPSFGDNELVDRLLARPFQSCMGYEWRTGCYCPTSNSTFGIVPRNYDGNFVGNDSASCMKCHESASEHVREFHFGRDWYGFIRGSDKILSWHPVDPSCLVRDASHGPITWRPELKPLIKVN